MDANQDADSYYVQDCRQVQNNTHTVQTLTGQISRLVGALDDRRHCRHVVDEAVGSVTRTILARIREHQKQAQNPAERNNRRMMYQKLSDNLGITARVLEDVDLLGVLSHGVPGCGGFQRGRGRRGRGRRASAGAAPEAGRDGTTAVRCVEEHMEALKRIYTDLASVAEEHDGTFESMSMDSLFLSTSMDIERGREEIHIPSYYRMSWLSQRTRGGGRGVRDGLCRRKCAEEVDSGRRLSGSTSYRRPSHVELKRPDLKTFHRGVVALGGSVAPGRVFCDLARFSLFALALDVHSVWVARQCSLSASGTPRLPLPV
ncbi:unnamed protein product [Prorocentrum cordatum]|uniref:Uncharacterized protein n=1 Tax=Prorocentrum cordatum TaxID=2364126 RepID=A0ABN9WTP4_9DINO|nr:unnamed protein product [Polarella glacialis]